jgi:enolase
MCWTQHIPDATGDRQGFAPILLAAVIGTQAVATLIARRTAPARTQPGCAVSAGIGNAALIKVNQVGTVSETLEALRVCRDSGYAATISHRSGETDDTFIADLAVGSGCGQIKSGAPARGERVAKYNRLLEIAASAPKRPFGLTR